MRFIIVIMAFVLVVTASAAAAGEPARISGFVDASYGGNLDTKENTFGLDQVEVDIEQDFGSNGFLRADLEWVKDGDGWSQDLEQGFLAFRPGFAPGWTFSLGKFNAPIGFELLDAPDMFQFSHALVFDYGLPTNLTGLKAAREFGEGFDLQAYVVNGWDDNNRSDSGPKTFGGRLGYAFGEKGGCGVSAITGREFVEAAGDPLDKALGEEFDRTVFDFDLTLTPAEGWTFGGEFNSGKRTVNGTDFEWTGFLVMAHYEVNSWFGFTGRYDSFEDKDAGIFDSGLAETRTAVTFAPTFVLGENMGALIELRVDSSDRDVFTDADGLPTDSTTSAAFEMTYSF